MKPIIRNTLAVVAGFIIGSIVNMAIILMSSSIIAPPNGADVTTMEGLQKTMHLFEPKHFLFPFIAHAVGTFAGAFATGIIAITNKTKLALLIGALFLLGGIVNSFTLPSPLWFTLVDLVLAYIPMAYFGGKLAAKKV